MFLFWQKISVESMLQKRSAILFSVNKNFILFWNDNLFQNEMGYPIFILYLLAASL